MKAIDSVFIRFMLTFNMLGNNLIVAFAFGSAMIDGEFGWTGSNTLMDYSMTIATLSMMILALFYTSYLLLEIISNKGGKNGIRKK